MKKACVFSGITLKENEVAQLNSTLTFKPPVKKGDVVKAVSSGFSTIIIIDGSFDWVAAVWHKEILFALQKGVQVIGASSMGALRASELCEYGMLGFGEVFLMYKSNLINQDADVAVTHIAGSEGSSIPLVNIRYSVKSLEESVQRRIVQACENIFYKTRTWEAIATVLPVNDFSLLKLLYVDIKKIDAIGCINSLNELCSTPVATFFQDSFFLNCLLESVEKFGLAAYLKAGFFNLNTIKDIDRQGYQRRVENLRNLLEPSFFDVESTQLINALAYIDKLKIFPTQVYKQKQFEKIRKEKGLYSLKQLVSWLGKNNLSEDGLDQAISDFVLLKKISSARGFAKKIYEKIYFDKPRPPQAIPKNK